MPRVADHDARRRQVAEAVERIIATDGLDNVSVARTAAAAGVSVGLVQHYFPTKDDMLLHTFTQIRARIEQRVTANAERNDAAGARIEHILLDGLSELLPLDDARRRECRVALAFAGRAVDVPALAEALRHSNAHLRALLAQAIRNAMKCGEIPRPVPDAAEAARLIAHVDGLILHAYTDPVAMPPATAQAALAEELSSLFSGPCHHPRPGTEPAEPDES